MPFLCRWGMLPVQLVETAAALTWSYLAMPSSNLDTMVPVVNVRGPHLLPVRRLCHACALQLSSAPAVLPASRNRWRGIALSEAIETAAAELLLRPV